jgi:amino acid permease
MILPRFSWVLDASLILYCGGAIISYLANIGSLLAQGFYSIAQWDLTSFSLRNASIVIQAVVLVFLVPLCCRKQFGSAQLASIFALSCIFYIVVMTLFYSPLTAARSDLAPLLRPAGILEVFEGFPIIIFAYISQFTVSNLVNELKEVSVRRLNQAYVMALSAVSVIYAICMLLPFLTFGKDVKQNYLQSLSNSDGSFEAPVIVSLIFTAFSLSMSYVILLMPVRISIMALIYGTQQPEGKRELRLRVFIALCIVFFTFGISAALGDNIALPIKISGLLGGNTLGFVFPFILYLKHYGLKNDRPVLSTAVLVALVFCCLLYPISLAGILKSRI